MERFAVVTGVSGVTHTLYEFETIKNISDIHQVAGPCYYRGQIMGVIKKIIDKPTIYVIIGLPCFRKARSIAQNSERGSYSFSPIG